MRELPHTHSCFVCGQSNAAGLNLRFETDGNVVQTRFCPQAAHIGFRGVVHGGIIATVLDEAMVWVCAARARRFAFCADLNVRFLLPLRPGQECNVTAELLENRRGKIFEAKSDLRDASGQLLALATGKYLPLRKGDLSDSLTDVVGDLSWVIG